MNYSEWTDEDINKEMQRRWALKLGYTDLKWFEDHYGESFGKKILRSSAHWGGVLPKGQPKDEGQYWNDDIRVEIPARYDWANRDDLVFSLADELFGAWYFLRNHNASGDTIEVDIVAKIHLVYHSETVRNARALCEAILDYSDSVLGGLFVK